MKIYVDFDDCLCETARAFTEIANSLVQITKDVRIGKKLREQYSAFKREDAKVFVHLGIYYEKVFLFGWLSRFYDFSIYGIREKIRYGNLIYPELFLNKL